MSQQNLAVVRRAIESMAATMDPHILVRADPRWPHQRFYGREAVIAFLRGVWESWGPNARAEEVIDLGDRLLVRWRFIVREQHSGVEGEQRISAIQTFREGRVILVEYFLGHGRALETLEMRE